MENPDPAPKKSGSIAAGIALVVCGLVVLVPSGLCTGLFFFGALINTILHPAHSDGGVMVLISLAVGGPFVAGGGALLWFGAKELIAYFRAQSGAGR
jgi:hypothetical protein